MDQIIISGYGYDFGELINEFHPVDKTSQDALKTMQKIIHQATEYDFEDAAYDSSLPSELGNYIVVQPNANSTDFQLFVYLPDVTTVNNLGIKTDTKTQADHDLAEYTFDILMNLYHAEENAMESKFQITANDQKLIKIFLQAYISNHADHAQYVDYC